MWQYGFRRLIFMHKLAMKHQKKKCSCRECRVTDLHPYGSAANVKADIPQRSLVRPKINYAKVAFYVILTVFGTFGIFFGCNAVQDALRGAGRLNCEYNRTLISVAVSSAALIIFIFICRKRILICFVHLYQRYASDEVRLRCVFTPSCSEYMILSIEKYGVIRGIRKGLNRLQRCHLPNGGEDYP